MCPYRGRMLAHLARSRAHRLQIESNILHGFHGEQAFQPLDRGLNLLYLVRQFHLCPDFIHLVPVLGVAEILHGVAERPARWRSAFYRGLRPIQFGGNRGEARRLVGKRGIFSHAVCNLTYLGSEIFDFTQYLLDFTRIHKVLRPFLGFTRLPLSLRSGRVS